MSFALTVAMCGFQFSLASSMTPSILSEGTGPSLKPGMSTVALRLCFFGCVVKWMSLYLSGSNFAPHKDYDDAIGGQHLSPQSSMKSKQLGISCFYGVWCFTHTQLSSCAGGERLLFCLCLLITHCVITSGGTPLSKSAFSSKMAMF